MNRYHRRCCRSPGWSAFMAGTVLPRALDGIDLRSRVLELGPGYGASSRPSLRWRLIHLGDTCTPIDPGTLPGRLEAAGFTRVAVDADERMVRFAAYTPGAEGKARPGAAA